MGDFNRAISEMEDFDKWWTDLSSYVFLKMSIPLTVYDMPKFEQYFYDGLTAKEAAKAYYGSL